MLDDKGLTYTGEALLAIHVTGVVHQMQRGKPLHPESVQYFERAKEYVSKATEEKEKIRKKDLKIGAHQFDNYGLALEVAGQLGSKKLRKYGIENIDKGLQLTEDYLNRLLECHRLQNNELQWLDDFFSAVHKFCMRKSGRPLERGPFGSTHMALAA